MRKYLVAFFGVWVAMFMALPVSAQTTDIAAIVARMEAIISEMTALQAEFQALSGDLAGSTATPAPNAAVLGAATDSLQAEVLPGATNETISKVQRLLATDPLIYPYGVVSGFFGPKTEEGIMNLQSRFGLNPVGVMGPATSEIVLGYFLMYPDENYPADVLKSKPGTPAVQGASITTQATAPTANTSSSRLRSIEIEEDDGEFVIELEFTNGDDKTVVTYSDDEDDIVDEILARTDLTRAEVEAVLDTDDIDRESRSDADEDDADDALDDAEVAIDEAEEEIEEAEEDGDYVDGAEDLLEEAEELLEEAEEAFDDEDYDEAVEKAEEAEELAKDAEDAIGDGNYDADEIEEIVAVITGEETEVTVEYENGDEEDFDVEENDEEDVIEEVADELNIDEDEVEDLIEFEYDDIDEIMVEVEDGEALVFVKFDDGAVNKFRLNETDEDEIIEEVADELNMDEDDVEDLIDIEYLD